MDIDKLKKIHKMVLENSRQVSLNEMHKLLVEYDVQKGTLTKINRVNQEIFKHCFLLLDNKSIYDLTKFKIEETPEETYIHNEINRLNKFINDNRCNLVIKIEKI